MELKRYNSLIDILSYKRSYSSFGELAFIQKYLTPIKGINRDDYGNYWIKVGTAPVIWSCHTDTVHRMGKDDTEDIRQKLAITEANLIWSVDGSCLGADNGVGIWLMLEMLKAGVEGLYVFHREEEIGGKGSDYFVKNNKVMLKDYKYAIAFDRRNTGSVITFQGRRTCSDAFADSLIAQLNLGHKKDTGGTFTDTKNYCDIVPECTNVSAGFYNEHSRMEELDIHYVGRLLDALLKMDLTALVCERDPNKREYLTTNSYPYSQYPYYSRGYGHGGTRHSSYYDDFSWDESEEEEELEDDDKIIQKNPLIVRELLEEWGIYDAFMDEIRGRTPF